MREICYNEISNYAGENLTEGGLTMMKNDAIIQSAGQDNDTLSTRNNVKILQKNHSMGSLCPHRVIFSFKENGTNEYR